MHRNRIITMSATIILGLGSLLAVPSAYAESLQEMKDKKSTIQEKRTDVQSDIHKTESKIKHLESQQLTVEEQLDQLEKDMTANENKIIEKTAEINKTNAEIESLKAEIVVLKDRIAKRNELLKERAVSYQVSGGNLNYLEVLLGASSFSEFIDRVSAVATIVEADQDIIKQHEQDKKSLEEAQSAVEKKKSDLEKMLAELQEIKQQLQVQKKKQEVLLAELHKQKEHAEHDMVGLEEEAVNLKAQETAIAQAIQLEQKRLAEAEAARKKAAEAAAAAAAAKAKQASSSGSSSTSSSSSNEVVSAPAVSSGTFTRPSAGYVSSGFGGRWGKSHNGIDIAASGTVPVIATADGVVIRAYKSSSYGNVVMVSHSINGQTFTSVYAHLNSMSVSAGQVVSKGQQVGYMGNTGHSYGQHLHFELHKGAWNAAKSNAVNPLNYVSM
ncbi:murein hydrolase activator EnvC family protein [Peribacillus huizhouensis]|uniref:Peptidoglycan hydrolase CwlO-like protein n=1 Tax=Peribacillus huizhouensis TaxID=1501239 RepID=A0ABR6CP33_9BACI|nr:peptidoglycan DD-metalloendopeptidase family protein [Peribacillus huizhouensis]MBA9026764.1 peptidoglycan hydrolase CwlO-like protein [Peribacillus huizhouensis]